MFTPSVINSFNILHISSHVNECPWKNYLLDKSWRWNLSLDLFKGGRHWSYNLWQWLINELLMIAAGLSKLQEQMILQDWEECSIWMPHLCWNLRTHFDSYYIYSSLELPYVHHQIYGNTRAYSHYLPATSAVEFLCYRTHGKYAHL